MFFLSYIFIFLSVSPVSLLSPALADTAVAALDTTCSAKQPCKQGCCSKSGYCGFGPDFCDKKNCVSTCKAEAECGKYAPKGKEKCALNVCCSKFGFCGTSERFCDKGCQNGCLRVKKPSCSGTSANKRYVGYFESWSSLRSCDAFKPSDINVEPWTHINYAFAQIDSKSYALKTSNFFDADFYKKFTALKKKKPSLKCFISIGGWDAGGKIFSEMAKNSKRRKSFIESVVKFMKKYDFDGVDVDWEYPVARDRGGISLDSQNYVLLLEELKAAVGNKYGLTIAIPASYWYLKGFDLKKMVKYVDWFNIMTYDIHGTWDGQNKWTDQAINPHTNLTEISSSLDLLWRNSIPAEKVLLGLGFYGKSFTLEDTKCNKPGCPFKRTNGTDSGGAKAGECTDSSGTLSDYEIARIIEDKSLKPIYDKTAAINYMTWDENQWVSFDDSRTLTQKLEFANKQCLGGTFAWALDLGGPGTLKHPGKLDGDNFNLDGADPNGDDSGSGEVYISPSIYKDKNPGVACVPPCTLIMPPVTLEDATTIEFPPYETSLEFAWPIVTTVAGNPKETTTSWTRTIQNTTLTIPPVVTSVISVWNWKITESDATKSSRAIVSSILPPPFVITNRYPHETGEPNPERTTDSDRPKPTGPNDTDQTTDPEHPEPTGPNDTEPPNSAETTDDGHTVPPIIPGGISLTSTRTITPRPYPHSTASHSGSLFPIITFTAGPAPPPCSKGCGSKCKLFCDKPCFLNCGGLPSPDFIDPNDPKPPPSIDFRGCKGPDCEVDGGINKCKGPQCVIFKCVEGDDCIDGVCVGPECNMKMCGGSKCDANCSGAQCKPGGCLGPDCFGSSGFCTGPQCFSFGCIGLDCITPKPGLPPACKGPRCKPVTCKGKDCKNGICTGNDCETDDCDDPNKADFCTELVQKIKTGTESTYSTTTGTQCSTVTACFAEDNTVTTTTTIDKHRTGTITEHFIATPTLASDKFKSLTDEIEKRRESRDCRRFSEDVSTTSTSKKSEPTTKFPDPKLANLHCADAGIRFAVVDEMQERVDSFCRPYDGRTLQSDEKLQYYDPIQGICDRECVLRLHISVKTLNGSTLKLGDDFKRICKAYLKRIVHGCDTESKLKQGGTIETKYTRWEMELLGGKVN